MTATQFMDTVLSINTTCSQTIAAEGKDERKTLLAAMNGNSKDPATLLQISYKYKNAYSCKYTTGNEPNMQLHECKPRSKPIKPIAKGEFPCSILYRKSMLSEHKATDLYLTIQIGDVHADLDPCLNSSRPPP